MTALTSFWIAGALAVAALVAAPQAARASDPCADHIPQAKPQNASRDIVGQDIDTIMERGFLTVALYEDYPPYSWEEGGDAKGVDADIARLIAEYIGVEPRFRFVAAGENLEADLRNNIWRGPLIGGSVQNVMMRVPYDSAFKCRVEQVVFPGQYHQESLAIAYRVADYPDGGPVPAYFRFDTVAVENDSIVDFYLTSFGGGQTAAGVRRFPTMADAMAALAAGETMAAMGPLAQLEYHARGNDAIAVHQPPLPGFAKSRWTLGTAVHFAYRPLSYTVGDAVFEGLSNGRIEEIFARYGLTHVPPEW
ncbi:ABC transporter substrate-binding protein [Cognatishimia sp. F0-27]|uniref:substrate-binding periplasmic protein n=1 Tax=Cognatishimia sp. F0-27 TaxID=2816855 RepID=UPI001D0C04A1|nr:transporter substrate-binding domain-containing protein [Cognatishimia sp. F0-27]MCC1494973.1 transporter substrate-binding domain-containing protein [Cognatishimia sp. F0-27]